VLVANCWLEAERARLKIPGIKDAIAQMMGGGDEMQQAMGLLDRSPDPAKLLQNLAGQVAQQHLARAGLGTMPPGNSGQKPQTAAPQFPPESTREAREAAKASAARSTATGATSPAAAPSTSTTAVSPSLVERVERRIDALRQKTQQFQTMLEARLASAEAQLAALRDELRRWTQTSTPDLPAEAPAQHSPAVDEAPLESTASHAPGTEGPRPSATEAEVMRSVELVEEFADELAEQQAASAARVEAIEREVLVLAGAVQASRAARRCPSPIVASMRGA